MVSGNKILSFSRNSNNKMHPHSTKNNYNGLIQERREKRKQKIAIKLATNDESSNGSLMRIGE